MARPRTQPAPAPAPTQAEATTPADREAQWQAYAGELARKLAAAEAAIAELERPLPKRTYCFSLPGGPVAWRIPATSEDRARAQLPADAGAVTFRGCA